MAETTKLTHKLRNPKSYNNWMNIWTAQVTDATHYEIYPSSEWKIPISQLSNIDEEGNSSDTLPSNINIPVSQVLDTTNPDTNITTHNVTILLPSVEPNVIPKTDNNGNLVAGPKINSSTGSRTKLLNEKGEWISLTAGTDIEINISNDNSNIIVKHVNKITGATVGTSLATSGSSLDVPYITYDNQGHITGTGTHTHTINGISGSAITGDGTLDPQVIRDIDSSGNPGLDTIIRGKLNTQTTNGAVRKGEENPLQVWATDINGNPNWRTIPSITGGTGPGITRTDKTSITVQTVTGTDGTNHVLVLPSTVLTEFYSANNFLYYSNPANSEGNNNGN